MKKLFKMAGIILLLLLVVASAIAAYVSFLLPDVGKAPQLKIDYTPERIARGSYLANNVAACMACHSKRDFRFFAGPVDSATFGAGGEKFGRDKGFPGNVYTTNITPYALHNWTDGEIYRAITEGVHKNGNALFPIMPYERFAQMEREDIYAIIAYVRTLKPIKQDHPERELDFPLNFIVNTIPAKADLTKTINRNNTIEYGKYLVNAASCIQCHTKQEKGELVKGMEFAGGDKFHTPAGVVYSKNITPDRETGIGSWTREQFIQRFAQYRDRAYRTTVLRSKDFNTPMPWMTYSQMTNEDLSAIYDYLCTVKPVTHNIELFQNPMSASIEQP